MDTLGTLLPRLLTVIPGPASRALADRLAAVESRNITFVDDGWPVFWDEARGANVRDADGNVYVDLTAAFGVALLGHGAPEVLDAIRREAPRLVHGMGDVHPPVAKVRFLEALARVLPWDQPRAVLGSSGSEAVEAALKTARLASGRPGIVALEGGYHGLTVGSLAATARPDFRGPVRDRLYPGVAFLPFPTEAGTPAPGETSVGAALAMLDRWIDDGVPTPSGRVPLGTVLLEPIQARGGVRALPSSFTAGLTERAREHDLIVVADEIYTGLGRCGSVLASPLVGLEPDIVCLGKILGGGMPLSACVAPARIMDAWPASDGEALHTSTFLGHPLACAVGEAVLRQVAADLPDRARALGERLGQGLESGLAGHPGVRVRGVGLLLGVDVVDDGTPRTGAGVRIARALLRRGVLALPAGDRGSVIELSPPVVLTEAQADFVVAAVVEAVQGELA
ncbi:MAG: aspartate aminotransferase family protein [Gemmatimonadetes bacterium]|nr:aspartate aminotransferase family protein [Gemmatimonadota bacterium]